MLFKFLKNHFSHKHNHVAIIVFLVTIFVIANAFYLMAVINKNLAPKSFSEFGVTFSVKQAQELGLDWKKTYTEILDDLGVRNFRIPVYWDRIEFNRGEFNFEDVDYMVSEAEKRNAKIILAIGQRVPRWPECHTPAWAADLKSEKYQEEVLKMMKEVVTRYQKSDAITTWQVENEPLLSIFGECPPSDVKFLRREADFVRALDSTRPVLITDSGELSFWLRVSAIADELGISMYRITWNPVVGYFFYPLTPTFYQNKVLYSQLFVKKVIVTELQAEPWADRPLPEVSIEDQLKTMNIDLFRGNIEFAKRANFEKVFLWGVEWWYWMKQQGHSEFWDEARTLFD